VYFLIFSPGGISSADHYGLWFENDFAPIIIAGFNSLLTIAGSAIGILIIAKPELFGDAVCNETTIFWAFWVRQIGTSAKFKVLFGMVVLVAMLPSVVYLIVMAGRVLIGTWNPAAIYEGPVIGFIRGLGATQIRLPVVAHDPGATQEAA
jgi:hypothetical protein